MILHRSSQHSLFIVLLILSLLSCVKIPKTEEAPSVVVPLEEMRTALVDAWDNGDAMSMKYDEIVYIETTQEVQGGSPIYTQGNRIRIYPRSSDPLTTGIVDCTLNENANVDRCVDNPSRVWFHMLQETNEASNSQTVSQDRWEAFVKTSLMSQATTSPEIKILNTQYPLGIDVVLSVLNLCAQPASKGISCQNLTKESGVVAPPPLIQKQENCGNIPNCQIKFRKINFDAVYTSTDSNTHTTTTNRISYSLTFSSDVPYLARLMEYCYKAIIPVNSTGQKALVRICNSVKNFAPGN